MSKGFMRRVRRLPSVQYARANDWEIAQTRNGHLRFRKHGKTVFAGSTPSDTRSDRNALAQLRGVDRNVDTIRGVW